MAKKKIPIPAFMKYLGSIDGPPDLSSRRGFSRGPIVEKIVQKKIVQKKIAEKAKVKVKPKKSRPRVVVAGRAHPVI